jgi:sorbitol/mannitol transport system substrate-binding protein
LQYIAIPEFADAGDIMTRNLADYVVDNITLDEALRRTQQVFEAVARDGGYKK